MQFVPDKECPADFLTKWVPKKKLLVSERFAENSANAVRECGHGGQVLAAVRGLW